jgi:hypothetical protein
MEETQAHLSNQSRSAPQRARDEFDMKNTIGAGGGS